MFFVDLTAVDGGSELVTVTCTNSEGFKSQSEDITLTATAAHGFCGDILTQSVTTTVDVNSPIMVSLTTVDPEPLTACGDVDSLSVSFSYNIVSEVGAVVEVTATTDFRGATCSVTDSPTSRKLLDECCIKFKSGLKGAGTDCVVHMHAMMKLYYNVDGQALTT